MQRVPYIDVQRQVAENLGRRDEDLLPQDQSALQRTVSRRLEFLWGRWWWRRLMRLEKRAYRDAYAAATAYAAPTLTNAVEVFYPATQKYYQTLRATTGNAPADSAGATTLAYWADCATSYSADNFSAALAYAQGAQVFYPTTDRFYQAHTATVAGELPTNTAKWGLLTEFDRYVAWLQPGQTKIGQLRRVWNLNPHVRRDALEVEQRETLNGIQVLADLAQCWVEFKIRCPRLTGSLWEAALAYTPVADEDSTGTPPPAVSGARTGIPGVAALRALTAHQDNQIEYLLWHTAEFDGGQGNVYFDAASMLVDDNGSVFKPDNIAVGAPGRWLRD